MENIKMIVTDLDNTLLNDAKRISPYTLDIIMQCQAQGIKFVPATARPLRKLIDLGVKGIFPYDALINCNGSKIYLNDEVIFQQGMSKTELDEFLPILLQHYGTRRISIEMDDTMYVNHKVWEVDPHEKNYEVSDLKDLPNGIIDRIILEIDSSEEVEKIMTILPDYLYVHAVSDAPICRILHQDVSKAFAIEHLANIWGIDKTEIVCFGDDANDLEMFAHCGQAIAMDNAIESVKAVATGFTKSNNEDGVAYWLEENVLKSV